MIYCLYLQKKLCSVPELWKFNIKADHVSIKPQQTKEDLFTESGESKGYELKKQREIAGEKLKEVLILYNLDGNSAEVKKKRVQYLLKAFDTSAWTEITNMRIEDINKGTALLKEILEGEK